MKALKHRFFLVLSLWLTCHAAHAGMIRDEEIERTLKALADPIFVAAGLDPETVDIFLIADDQLNAFVAGGQNLFLNTGLLIRSENFGQIAGVIAHETGHIAGGHLTRLNTASKNAAAEALIGAVLGAAAVVAGAPQLGTAIIAGGATVARSNLLAFSRGQEQAADQAAITYLKATKRSPAGLLSFFRILENQNLRINVDGNEFLRTHPLTRNRIVFLQKQTEDLSYLPADDSAEEHKRHQRMVAKLDGFLGDRAAVFRDWPGDTIPDRYARAIALYRASEIEEAIEIIDALLLELPNDPWFLELKGQIYFESGQIDEAVEPYRLAVANADDSALLRLGLGRALIERGGDLSEAIEFLEEATRIEPRNPSVWRFLGLALGRSGEEGLASLALAEHAVLTRNRANANLYLSRARKHLEKGDPHWLQLRDLERAVEEMRAG